ncbi:hypothetical protein [Streptomyces sp. NPDC087212]|uniref:hypothetical protein n=1 Tax=Streptomyces sp. NPDC087212 TaxID=3365766 RepID=UPI0037FB10B7
MHRTTTTATLLVTVAVSALTGCVTVQRPPLPGPASAPALPPSAPRPDGRGEPRIVQAPALEALELTGPSPTPRRSASPRPAAPAPARQPEASQRRPRQDARPPHPEQRPRHHRHTPGVQVPDVTQAVPRSQQDVCALGRTYGGWSADSPQSQVCGLTYRR